MTLQELLRVVAEALPQASIGEDNDGQLIIYTNLYEPYGGAELRPLYAEEVEEPPGI